MVSEEVKLIYYCDICHREYDKFEEARSCEESGNGELEIMAGEVFKMRCPEQIVLFVQDVSGQKKFRGLAKHFPYWQTAYIDNKKQKVQPVSYREINPKNYTKVSPYEFNTAKKLFLQQREIFIAFDDEKDLVIGNIRNMTSRWTILSHQIKLALKNENYERAIELRNHLREFLEY